MNYKKMALLPIPLLIICAIYLYFIIQTNQLALDIDFKGGTQIVATSERQINVNELESVLKQYDANVRTARGITGYTVFINFDTSIKSEDVLSTLKQNGYEFKDYSIQTIGPSLGSDFFQQALIVLAFSFVFMAVTVFIMFKTPLPSFYLVLTVIADLIETLVFSQIIGIKLSLAVFASLLLLIGGAVGDNILFTTRILKSTGKNYDEIIKKSFKTGMTLVGTVMAAMAALLIISSSIAIDQIASVQLIGMSVDVLNSWVLNLGLLMWFVTRKIK
jgi:preprotein translocase subunit SecF